MCGCCSLPGEPLVTTGSRRRLPSWIHGVVHRGACLRFRAIPSDWNTAVVLVPHPTNPEYWLRGRPSPKWTSSGKPFHYALACRGEVGIEGWPPE